MEMPLNLDQIPFGTDALYFAQPSDFTMSNFSEWPMDATDIDSFLASFSSTFDQTTFTAETRTASLQRTRATSPALESAPTTTKIHSRQKRRTDDMLLISNPAMALPTQSHSRSSMSSAHPSPRVRDSRSASPAPLDLQQRDRSTGEQHFLPEPTSTSSGPQSYVCEHCNTAFRFSRDFWQHKAQVHNVFRYKCQLGCGKGFARHDNLVQHHRESKRHRRSDSPSELEELSRRKKARKASVTLESEYTPRDSLASPGSSSTTSHQHNHGRPLAQFNEAGEIVSVRGSTASLSAGTPRDSDAGGDSYMHPEFLKLQRRLEMMTAKYELVKKENQALRDENEELQAREFLRGRR